MKKTYFLLPGLLALSLVGCYTPVIEGAQQGYDVARRGPLQDKARTGDRVAEYEFANTYCCKGAGPLKEASVYDNNKATYWYCKSAHQGYAASQLRLARIYSGDPIRGLHVILRASDLMGTDPVDLAVAQMWAELATRKGDGDAIELRDEIKQKATKEEQLQSASYLKDWQKAPCTWSTVFSKNS